MAQANLKHFMEKTNELEPPVPPDLTRFSFRGPTRKVLSFEIQQEKRKLEDIKEEEYPSSEDEKEGLERRLRLSRL